MRYGIDGWVWGVILYVLVYFFQEKVNGVVFSLSLLPPFPFPMERSSSFILFSSPDPLLL